MFWKDFICLKNHLLKKLYLLISTLIKVPGFDEFDELYRYFIEESRRRVVFRQGFRYRLNFMNFKAIYTLFYYTQNYFDDRFLRSYYRRDLHVSITLADSTFSYGFSSDEHYGVFFRS